jgi:hypothetical protein
MENVFLIFDESDPEHMEDTLWTRKCLSTKGVLREALDQMVADLGVYEILLAPLKTDELLLRGQVEVQKPLDELSSLQSLKPACVDKVSLTEFKDIWPVPLAPVLDTQDPCGLHFRLVLCLVYVFVILGLQVTLVVGDDLVVGQTDLRIYEKLVTMHEQGAEVSRPQSLPCP